MTEWILIAVTVASYVLWPVYVWAHFRPVSRLPTLERALLTLLSPILFPAAICLGIVGAILEVTHAVSHRTDPPADKD